MKFRLLKCLLLPVLLTSVRAFGQSIPLEFPPVNSFTAGCGFTGVAMVDNAATIYWNPAGLAFLDDQSVEFTASGRKLHIPGSWSLMVANNAYDEKKPFGFGIVRRLTGQNNPDIIESELSKEVRSFSVITPIAFKSRRGDFAVGVSLKFIGEKISGSDWKHGSAFDAGTIWKVGKELFLTSTSRNYIGSNLHTFPSESWFGASLGNSYTPLQLGIQVRGDRLQQLKWTSRHFRYGGRIRLEDIAWEFRGGFIRQGDDSWITAGIAYWTVRDDSHFDYTVMLNQGDRGNTVHFMTYGYSVGDPLMREIRRLNR